MRRLDPKGQVLQHVLWHVPRSALRNSLRRVLDMLALMCHLRSSVKWVPPPADNDGQDKAFTMNAFKIPFSSQRPARPSPRPALSLLRASSPKGKRGSTRLFGVGSELADGDGQDKHLPQPRPPLRLGRLKNTRAEMNTSSNYWRRRWWWWWRRRQ